MRWGWPAARTYRGRRRTRQARFGRPASTLCTALDAAQRGRHVYARGPRPAAECPAPQHLVGEPRPPCHERDPALVETAATRSQTLCTAGRAGCDEQAARRRPNPPFKSRESSPADSLAVGMAGFLSPGGRLVENGDLGLLHDDLGDAQPLAHARASRVATRLVDHVGELPRSSPSLP